MVFFAFVGVELTVALTAARAFLAASAALRAINARSIIVLPSPGLLSNQISKFFPRVEEIKEVSILVTLLLTCAS